MMESCLPGINNYNLYVRGFSVIAWIYWKYFKLAEEMGIEQPSESQLGIFKDKVEILFTWGHHGLNLPKIPGITSKPPKTDEAVELSFSAWTRSIDNTSLMAAPNYGPASKNTGGLGFIAPVSGAFYKVCGNGIKLAEALDVQLAKRTSYALITTLNPVNGDEGNAKDLLPSWDVRTPSLDEQKYFQSSFYNQNEIGCTTKIGLRSATLSLIMKILDYADTPLSEAELRVAMAYGKLPQRDYLPLSGNLETARLRWLILQVRQAQRLALESIFSWTERRIMSFEEKETFSIVKSTLAVIRVGNEILPEGDKAGQIMALFLSHINGLRDLIDAAENDPRYCIFDLMQELQEKLKTNLKMIIPYALRLLFICSKYVDLLKEHETVTSLLNHGGAERISLLYWNDTLMKWAERPIGELLLYLLENLILSQHFGVAASRFDGEKQRLRIAIEEEGLVPLVAFPLQPFVGEDRLSTALSLMADCGLIASSGGGIYCCKALMHDQN